MTQKELEALHSTLFRLETRWVGPQSDDPDWHGYDPQPLADFLVGMRLAAAATSGRRFLDIGCGIGTKLAFMYHQGWEVAGIEHDAELVMAARELVPEATITISDVRDVEHFDSDVVFMYRPARDDDVELSLERQVSDRMTPGSILYLPYRDVELLGLTALSREVGVR